MSRWPSQQLNPRQRFTARLALAVLGLATLASALAWILHATSNQPKPLDLIVPPLATLINLAILLVVWRRPRRARLGILAAALAMTAVMAGTSGWFIHAATQPGGRPLVEVLPPMPTLLLGSIVVVLLFFRTATALRLGIGMWLLVALPLLVYLMLHPHERDTARGLELIMLLGPMTLLLAVMIPLQRERERQLQDLQRAELRARTRAMRDPLTDLFNRRAFEDRLAGVIAQSQQPQQLILLDIDHFKSINDNHGHPAGDRVLQEIAQRCASQLDRGAMFARWGGEEFAVICPQPDGDPRRVAERLRSAIAAAPIDPVGGVSASFGVSRIRNDDSLESAVKRADAALYLAKQNGRNRVEVA